MDFLTPEGVSLFLLFLLALNLGEYRYKAKPGVVKGSLIPILVILAAAGLSMVNPWLSPVALFLAYIAIVAVNIMAEEKIEKLEM